METEKLRDKKAFVYFCSLVAAVMFGVSFAATKGVLQHIDPFQLMAYRWLLAFAVFSLLAALGIVKLSLKGKPIRYLAALSLTQPVLYSIFETYGIQLTTSSESAILLSAVPVVVILLSVFFLKKKVSRRIIFFVALSLAGVVITVVFAPDFGLGGKSLGYLMLLGAVITGALYSLMGNSFSSSFSPQEITFAMTLAGAVSFNTIYFCMGYSAADYVESFTHPSTLLPILYLGLCCSILCFFLSNFVLARIPAPQASTLQVNIITITGTISGFLVYGESLSWYKLLGILFILAGVIGANRGEDKQIEKTTAEHAAAAQETLSK